MIVCDCRGATPQVQRADHAGGQSALPPLPPAHRALLQRLAPAAAGNSGLLAAITSGSNARLPMRKWFSDCRAPFGLSRTFQIIEHISDYQALCVLCDFDLVCCLILRCFKRRGVPRIEDSEVETEDDSSIEHWCGCLCIPSVGWPPRCGGFALRCRQPEPILQLMVTKTLKKVVFFWFLPPFFSSSDAGSPTCSRSPTPATPPAPSRAASPNRTQSRTGDQRVPQRQRWTTKP